MPASTTPSRVRVEGCLKKKVCTPLTRAQPQGQVKSSVTTFPQPAQPGKGSGTDSGVPWGGVLARLSRSCLAVSARAQASEPCWRRWTTGRQVSTPAPAEEVWGGWGDPEAFAGQKKGHGSLGREVPGRRRAEDFGNELSPKAS